MNKLFIQGEYVASYLWSLSTILKACIVVYARDKQCLFMVLFRYRTTAVPGYRAAPHPQRSNRVEFRSPPLETRNHRDTNRKTFLFAIMYVL